MPAMGTVIESVLRAVLAFARRLFWLQTLALGCAAMSVSMIPMETPIWMQSTLRSLAGAAVAFGLAAVAMTIANRPALCRRMHQGAIQAGAVPVWMIAAAAAGAAFASYPLPEFWGEVRAQIEPLALGDDVARPGPFAGLGVLLAMVVVAVPALVTVAAVASFVFPVAVLPLLVKGHVAGGGLFAAVVACLGGLVLGARLAMAAMAELVALAVASMRTSGDVEVLAIADTLTRLSAGITEVAAGLTAPLLVLVGVALYVWSQGGRGLESASVAGKEGIAPEVGRRS